MNGYGTYQVLYEASDKNIGKAIKRVYYKKAASNAFKKLAKHSDVTVAGSDISYIPKDYHKKQYDRAWDNAMSAMKKYEKYADDEHPVDPKVCGF